MKYLLLLCMALSLPLYAQEDLVIEDKWKVDVSSSSEVDNFWPEQRVRKEPVNFNLPENQIRIQDLKDLQKYDKHSFKNLMHKYGDYENNRVYISLDGADKSVLEMAAAASLGLIVLKGDDDLMDVIQNNKSDRTKKLAAFGYEMGRKEGLLPIVAGAYFLGVVFENDKMKDVGIISVSAQLAAQLVVEVFKEASGRERPRAGNGAYSFNVNGAKSFISGHAAGAFSLATLLTDIFGEEYPIVPYLSYGVAAITAWSRMHDEGHWGSDVILGAVAGHLITRIVYRLYRGGDVPEDQRNLYVVPYVDQSIDGLGPFERRRSEVGIRVHLTLQRPTPSRR